MLINKGLYNFAFMLAPKIIDIICLRVIDRRHKYSYAQCIQNCEHLSILCPNISFYLSLKCFFKQKYSSGNNLLSLCNEDDICLITETFIIHIRAISKNVVTAAISGQDHLHLESISLLFLFSKEKLFLKLWHFCLLTRMLNK